MSVTQTEKTIVKRRIEKHKTKNLLLGIIIFAAVLLSTSISIFCVESEIELAGMGTSSLTEIAYILVIFLLVVILTAGVSVKSIYEVLLINDMVEFRKLKLLGATAEQLKNIVRRERRIIFFRYGVAGALAGAALSIFFPLTFNAVAIVGCTIISLTVMCIVVSRCTNKLVRRVMNVSISVDLDNYNTSKRKKKSNTKRLLKAPARFLGIRYLRSGGKRSLVTLLSLTLSFTLSFVILSLLAAFDEEKLAKEDYKFDSKFIVSMTGYGEGGYTEMLMKSPFTGELEQKIRNISGVEEIVKYRLLKMNFTNDTDTHSLCNADVTVSRAEGDGCIPVVINKGAYWYRNGSHTYALGDKIEAIVHCGELDKQVVLVVDGFVNREYDLEIYYTSDENLDILTDVCCDCKWYLRVDEENMTEGAVDMLKKFVDADENLRLSSYRDYYEQLTDGFRNVKIAIYVVCIIICMFTLINVFDLLVNNLVKRQRDIGVYRTLGMSMKQLSALNYVETGFFIVFSGMGGILIGTPLSCFLCKTIAELFNSSYLVYVFPVGYCTVYILFIFVIYLVMKKYVKEFVEKVQIMDSLKT